VVIALMLIIDTHLSQHVGSYVDRCSQGTTKMCFYFFSSTNSDQPSIPASIHNRSWDSWSAQSPPRVQTICCLSQTNSCCGLLSVTVYYTWHVRTKPVLHELSSEQDKYL